MTDDTTGTDPAAARVEEMARMLARRRHGNEDAWISFTEAAKTFLEDVAKLRAYGVDRRKAKLWKL